MSDTHHQHSTITIRRAYEEPASADGYRVLVDRLWPRGRSKGTLKLDQWAPELAPSVDLRKWFGHDPQRWEIFAQRYRSELAAADQQQQMQLLLTNAEGQTITLVYGAKDERHNHALVLCEVLSQLPYK